MTPILDFINKDTASPRNLGAALRSGTAAALNIYTEFIRLHHSTLAVTAEANIPPSRTAGSFSSINAYGFDLGYTSSIL